ncbi:MAG: enoyl-CoA hydratase-related protein [Actinobacteria bacterium]|nr:enoyl-CoA hydratase-related protein [Actinomycetota bacterium]
MSVRYELRDDVAVVIMDRPDRFNAIEAGLSVAMIEALARAGVESRAVVVTGAGRAFCSGADLADLVEDYERDGPDLAGHLERVFHPLIEAVIGCAVPTIAAVNGVAAGAGLGLALACDLRVMAQGATLTSAFTGIGLVPDSGTTWWLPSMIGVGRALELALTNRRVGPDEALTLGLCTSVHPDEELLDAALTTAAALASLVPDSLVTTRRLIREAAGTGLSEALRAEQTEQGRLGRTPEHLEGVRAFLDKRKPDYRRFGPGPGGQDG